MKVQIRLTLFFILTQSSLAGLADEIRVYEPGQLPNDCRLQSPKDLDGYFPFDVPESVSTWEQRAAVLRRRTRVATGLWPWPERTPLNPVIHSRTHRPGFTVEKVYFESVPGHFVTGLLFRPDDGQSADGQTADATTRRPAVLCPHGHGGRLQDYGVDAMAELIASGAERFEKSGRFPKMARCAQLARMGCVVFIFDMIGYADSQQISDELAHRFARQRPELESTERWGLYSAQAEMRLQSIMGLQTWNGIRCLDFLEQLPDVDASRIAVTGGSGGGTQTILLGAIDPRPIAAFPNGMVSTAMQGGCTCENCCLLRIDSGNVELAALFAPKPQGMTAANDWTKDMMTKGYPELQRLYAMLGAPENVYCREMLHFPHNYNAVSRETMYAWFNKHLNLGQTEPIHETDWEPLTPAELTVWDAAHPQPTGGDDYELSLTTSLAEASDRQLAAIAPTDADSLRQFQDVVGAAWKSIIGREIPKPNDIERTKVDKRQHAGFIVFEDILRHKSRSEELPIVSLYPTEKPWNGTVVVWLDGDGKQGMFTDASEDHPVLKSAVKRLLDGGTSIIGVDLFLQGEFKLDATPITEQPVVSNPREAAPFTFAYNDTLFARRVHDVLTVMAFIQDDTHDTQRIHIVATTGAGPVAAVARAICGDQINKAFIDTGGFRFAQIRSYCDPHFLPGAVKYGDLPAILALGAPNPTRLAGEAEMPSMVKQAYVASDAEPKIERSELDAAVDWMLPR